MKHPALLFFLFLLFASAPVFAAQEAEVGKTAPDFTLTDTYGHQQRLGNYRGKIVVLEWTNHECPYVRKHYGSGNMQALQKEAVAQDVIWFSIVSSAKGQQGYTDMDQANAVIAETGAMARARLLDFDGAVGRLYGAKTTPQMFVIDRDGILAYSGAIDDAPSTDPATLANAHNYIRAALADLKTGRPVKTPLTHPYGCSIKYGN